MKKLSYLLVVCFLSVYLVQVITSQITNSSSVALELLPKTQATSLTKYLSVSDSMNNVTFTLTDSVYPSFIPGGIQSWMSSAIYWTWPKNTFNLYTTTTGTIDVMALFYTGTAIPDSAGGITRADSSLQYFTAIDSMVIATGPQFKSVTAGGASHMYVKFRCGPTNEGTNITGFLRRSLY